MPCKMPWLAGGKNVSQGNVVGIAVPFTAEEVQHLTALARAHGGSVVDLIRSRIFGPGLATDEVSSADEDDVTTLMARLEGIRIRSERRD